MPDQAGQAERTALPFDRNKSEKSSKKEREVETGRGLSEAAIKFFREKGRVTNKIAHRGGGEGAGSRSLGGATATV